MKRALTVAIVGTVFVPVLLPSSMQMQTSKAASLITVPRVDRNIIRNSAPNDLFFGVAVRDSENTISNTKISGDKVLVGVLAAAFEVNTIATLDNVIIKGAETQRKNYQWERQRKLSSCQDLL
jgi:hypothetical protein